MKNLIIVMSSALLVSCTALQAHHSAVMEMSLNEQASSQTCGKLSESEANIVKPMASFHLVSANSGQSHERAGSTEKWEDLFSDELPKNEISRYYAASLTLVSDLIYGF